MGESENYTVEDLRANNDIEESADGGDVEENVMVRFLAESFITGIYLRKNSLIYLNWD